MHDFHQFLGEDRVTKPYVLLFEIVHLKKSIKNSTES